METRHLTLLQKINRLLLAGSGLCVLCMLFRAIRPSPVGEGKVDAPSSQPTFAKASAGRPSPVASAGRRSEWNIADLSRRNLFKSLIAPPPPPKVVVQAPLAPPPPPKIPLSQRVAHLKLVGIIDSTPLQAIIENQRDQKTIYVAAGQSIDDVQVKTVTADQVILSSGDERFNLTL